MINKVVEVITKTDHEAVSSIRLNIRHPDVIRCSNHKFIKSYFHYWCNLKLLAVESVLYCSVAYPERERVDIIKECTH